jgi:hypothetical protein
LFSRQGKISSMNACVMAMNFRRGRVTLLFRDLECLLESSMFPKASKSSTKPFGIILTSSFLGGILYVYLLFLNIFQRIQI